MPPKSSGLPTKKVALLHVARKRLHMGEDDYRLLLLRVAGVESARDLSEAGFRQVMEAFAALGFTSDTAKANFGRRADMATPGQIAAIRRMWREFTAGEGTDASLGAWLEKHWRISALRFLPAAIAPKVLIALRSMTTRRAANAKVA